MRSIAIAIDIKKIHDIGINVLRISQYLWLPRVVENLVIRIGGSFYANKSDCWKCDYFLSPCTAISIWNTPNTVSTVFSPLDSAIVYSSARRMCTCSSSIVRVKTTFNLFCTYSRKSYQTSQNQTESLVLSGILLRIYASIEPKVSWSAQSSSTLFVSQSTFDWLLAITMNIIRSCDTLVFVAWKKRNDKKRKFHKMTRVLDNSHYFPDQQIDSINRQFSTLWQLTKKNPKPHIVPLNQ